MRRDRALRRALSSVLATVVLASLPLSAVRGEDVEGAADHPLLTRLPGATIVQYSHRDFDEMFWCKDSKCEDRERVEGEITRITYSLGSDQSTLGVIRSYEKALTGAGFEMEFSCSEPACPRPRYYLELPGEDPVGGGERFYDDGRRLSVLRKGGDYVSVYAYRGSENVRARIRVVEGDAEEAEILVNAQAISDGISSKGSIALYGIFFDVDKAVVGPGSEATLLEIARYLKAHPEARLHVVGHTDNTGSLKHNLDLSRRRALAVVGLLVSAHSISGERLSAQGVGPLAPVESNGTEDGRSKNRRVQLVLM